MQIVVTMDGGVKSQWGSGALLVSLTAEGKKQFLWREVLVMSYTGLTA